jgi:hypothetical protein
MDDNKTLQATLIQVLFRYEKPEVILLESSNLKYTLAIRSADLESSGSTYVGGTMSARRLRDYANGKCDLRYAIAHANLRKFWKFELLDGIKSVTMKQIKRSDHELIESLPEPQFFARDHSEIDVVKKYIPDTVEQFDIDGGWDLGEFSQFYGQIEDIYYIVSDIERYDDLNISNDEKNVITDAFDRSWDGGGSYVAFYKKVANDNDYHAPLRVSGIQYNSPGHVKIHAKSEIFNSLLGILQYYSKNEKIARKSYHSLSNLMTFNKLKKKNVIKPFISAELKDQLTGRCKDLEDHLPGISFDALMAMTKGDLIVSAKVLSSIFRRVEKLYKYFDEGRVSHPHIELQDQ